MTPPLRGRAYFVDLGHLGEKPFVVVSNNDRNNKLPSVLAIRITTTVKAALPTVVELGPADPLTGRALCDDLMQLATHRVRRDAGALSLPTMRAIEDGLRAALAL